MALRETLDHISSMTTPTDEKTTIDDFILPILEDLGWDVNSEEVKREYTVSGMKERGRVDIALMQGDRCICVVEAKKLGKNLDGYVDQVFRYAYYEGVTFCVLSDGLEWRLYLPNVKVRLEERQFAILQLKDNPTEQSENDLKRFLSRKAVLSGSAESDALNQLQIDRELLDIWRKMLVEPDRELVTWVERRISDKHGLSLSADQVAKIIVATTAPSQPVYRSKPIDPGVSKEDVKRPAGYTLFGVPKPWLYGINMWVDVVEHVYSRHERDFLEVAEKLRLSPHSRRILISETPLNEDRDWTRTGIPKIFVYSNLKVDVFIELAHELLKIFGHPASDLEIHWN